MKNRRSSIAVLLLILVALACDGVSHIGGRVVDIDGKPVEHASVLFEAVEKGEPKSSYECETITSADGFFSCGFVHAPWNIRLRLTITKEGYKTYTRELSSKEVYESTGGNMGTQIISLETR